MNGLAHTLSINSLRLIQVSPEQPNGKSTDCTTPVRGVWCEGTAPRTMKLYLAYREDRTMKNERDDITLQRAIIDELDWEPSVNAAGIGVMVKEGVVILAGYVPSYAQKRAAEQAVLRVPGVKAVVEEIEVHLPSAQKRTDVDIAKAVVDAIKWHVHLPQTLKVKVESGWVTLEGEVEWQYQRTKAFDAVHNLTGVEGILNLIKVKPRLTPAGIKEKIQKALERAAKEDVDGIKVDVEGSEVTLSGSVRTWVERADAARAAWSAPGVTEVTNNIEIGSHTCA